jgi:hypothetical protein
MIATAIKSARNHWRNACASVQRAMAMSNLRTEIKFLIEDIADIEERAANRVSQAVYYEGEVLPDLHTRLIRAQDQLARLHRPSQRDSHQWPPHLNRRHDYTTRVDVHVTRGKLTNRTLTAAQAIKALHALGISHADTMRILTKPPAGRRSRPGTNTSTNPHGRSGLASVRDHSGN